jgi:hypothetical protein
MMAALLAGSACADAAVGEITHREFQAVNAVGEQTYTATEEVVLEGIVLNNPADMLDPTPDDSVATMYDVSGQWQIFFQGIGGDHAGTAVWMGQLYDNLPWVAPGGGYTNEQFIAELTRINAAQFCPGDLVRVTGYFLSYKGKCNVNEQHNNNPDHDFTIELIEPGVGLPEPELITLDELKDDDDAFIFDPDRLLGGEYYQGCLVRINDVAFVDPSGWGPGGELTITDGVKTLPLKLGRGNGIYAGSCNLTEPFDVIGIIDQDSASLVDGYRLYVMNYDGNGQVLAARENRMVDCPKMTEPDVAEWRH